MTRLEFGAMLTIKLLLCLIFLLVWFLAIINRCLLFVTKVAVSSIHHYFFISAKNEMVCSLSSTDHIWLVIIFFYWKSAKLSAFVFIPKIRLIYGRILLFHSKCINIDLSRSRLRALSRSHLPLMKLDNSCYHNLPILN